MWDAKCACGKRLLMTLREREKRGMWDAKCTCGKWLLMTLWERRRTVHMECGVHSWRVTFDAGGAKKNNVIRVHLWKVAFQVTLRKRKEQCIANAEGHLREVAF